MLWVIFIIGISATTGALADNHDILSLQAYSDVKVLQLYGHLCIVHELVCIQLSNQLHRFSSIVYLPIYLSSYWIYPPIYLSHKVLEADDSMGKSALVIREDNAEGRIDQ